MKFWIVLWSLLALGGVQAASVTYSDTTTDTGGTVFFSTGPYTQIGDEITLGGTDRLATSATAQLFNGGSSSGTFDAMLTFFAVGSPVGAQVGSPFTVTGTSIAPSGVATVTFGNLNSLSVPDSLIFTIAVSNVSAGLDLALTMFDPPTIGSSDPTFFIVNDGTSFSTASTLGAFPDNFYFSLTANPSVSPIPEPASWILASAGLALAGLKMRAAKQATEPRAPASGIYDSNCSGNTA
jgi:hypothetical protein